MLQNNLKANIEEKDCEIHLEQINLKELINEKIESFSNLYPKLNYELYTENDKEHIYINTDKHQLEMIIDNLISNASKYNKKEGSVKITISENQIIIQDEGKGIKDITKLFDRFYKENVRGLGLGMNIVKKAIDRLNYKIDIESEINKGTKVSIEF